MSLFSLARRLPTATITTTFLPWRPLIQQRSVWQEVIRRIPSEDPQKAGQMTFEDVDVSDMRIGRALRAEAPLRKRTKFLRHEKGWMRRKRLKMETRYLRLQEGVDQLKSYIKFKQENK
ncbi:hypothetical protein ACHAWO_008995 [Cyclotella atomus]|uniref:Mitochondrial mRNA-processing protein COX24 C-terminal domain-containing protein n=1 Tax=Cyclotella atomus TaxID=382360 RepID=A0ABD3Q9Q5_9STRA